MGEMPGAGDVLRIGTRGSRLARWQSEWVASELRQLHPGLTVELVEIKTAGDRDRNSPLAAIGGTGLFTKEIQRALLDGRVEVAVHSLKDLPTLEAGGLVLGAVPERERRTDALIAPRFRTLDALPAGARVGTSSLRRRAMLLHARPDLRVENLRGNVETRLRAATEGTLDAVVLAEAGLVRLGLADHVTERLEPPRFLPAVGQGALGLECRGDDESTLAWLAPMNHGPTHHDVTAERTLLAELGGGCLLPLGASASVESVDRRVLSAVVLDPDGRERLDVTDTGPADDPEGLGRRVAERLREGGADRILGLTRDR